MLGGYAVKDIWYNLVALAEIDWKHRTPIYPKLGSIA